MKKMLIVLFLLALTGFACTSVITYSTGGDCTVNVSPNQPLDVGVQVNGRPTTQPAKE